MVTRNRSNGASTAQQQSRAPASNGNSRFTGTSRSSFQYHGRDASFIKQRAEMQNSMYDSYLLDSYQQFKPTAGEHTIRILPPTWQDRVKWGNNWGIDVHLHYNVGPENQAYLCPNKMLGLPCAVCDFRAELFEDGNEKDAKALNLSRRVLCWLINRKDEKAGPILWGMAGTTETDIQDRSRDRKTGAAFLIDHPDEGFDVFFIREGNKKENTKYRSVEVDRDASPIFTDGELMEKTLEFISQHPLPDVLRFYPNEYLFKLCNGTSTPAAETQPVQRTTRQRLEEQPQEQAEDEDEISFDNAAGVDASEEPASAQESEPEPKVEEVPEPRTRRGAAPAPATTQSQGRSVLSKLRQRVQ